MKKKIIVLLMTMTMAASVLAGCGADQTNVADNKKTETSAKSDSTNETEDLKEDVDATENNADASKGEDSQEVNPFLGPNGLMFASEEDVVINIAGVDVPMTSTRDELIALIEENNWEIDYGHSNGKYVEGFLTPEGRVETTVNDSKEDGSGEELMGLTFKPDYMDYIDLSKVYINGVSLDKVETLKTSSNLIEEKDTGYFQISIADYTTLSADYNYEGKMTVLHITRKQHSLR